MKKILFISAFIATLLTMRAQQTAELERLVNQTRREADMKHGMLAVSVYNVTTGKEVYSHNGDLSLTPASVAKLFTTGVGFARLGKDFRFTTKVGVRGDTDRDGVLHGNIYIIGGGDPLLGSYRYRQTTPDSLFGSWTQALKKKGIRRVDGRVCYNTTVFDEQPLHDSWQWGDVGNYYGAGVCGLNFHENMYFVYFNPGKRIGYPATAVRTVPKNIDIHGNCEVTTAAENTGDNVVIYGTPTGKERLYRGTVPLGKNDFAVRGALPNPARTCADLFASHLRTRGIGVSSNSMQVYSVPDSLRQVVEYRSSSYYTIAQYTNLTSNNIYAESIFKYLGYAKYGIGSFANGRDGLVCREAARHRRHHHRRRQRPVAPQPHHHRLPVPLPRGREQGGVPRRVHAVDGQGGRKRHRQEPAARPAGRHHRKGEDGHYGRREVLRRIHHHTPRADALIRNNKQRPRLFGSGRCG